jgi:probable rRNA maturation factor
MSPAAKSSDENSRRSPRSSAAPSGGPSSPGRSPSSKTRKAAKKSAAKKLASQKRKADARKKTRLHGVTKSKNSFALVLGEAGGLTSGELEVNVADHQHLFRIDRSLLRRAARQVFLDFGIKRGQVTIAVVRDQAIRRLNRLYLREDEPTDVLSFSLERSGDMLEGEIIVSSETALTQAQLCGNDPEGELLLYVIHGALHLVGFDDHRPRDRAKMRQQERRYLKQFGFKVRLTPLPSPGKAS